MAAVFKSNRQNLDDLWANDETGMEIFRSTVSLQCFRFLLQCLRFDDRTRSLAIDLMKEHHREHAACSLFSRELWTKLKQWITSPAIEPEAKRPKLQARCAICPLSKGRKTKYMCQKCKKFLCLQHVILFYKLYKKLT